MFICLLFCFFKIKRRMNKTKTKHIRHIMFIYLIQIIQTLSIFWSEVSFIFSINIATLFFMKKISQTHTLLIVPSCTLFVQTLTFSRNRLLSKFAPFLGVQSPIFLSHKIYFIFNYV